MAEKITKKTTAKKPVAKKTVAKPAVAKKPVAKKAPAKKPVAKKPVVTPIAPVVEPHACGCHHDGVCMCSKKKCTFGRFFKKLILIMIIFALGFVAAKMCNHHGPRRPRPVFENGCLVVKCPKLAERAPMMDADGDGCITRAEFKAAKKQMFAKPSESAPMPTPAPVVAEPAPMIAE